MADAVVGTLRAMLALDTAQFEAGAKKGKAAVTELEKTLAKLGDGTGRLTTQAERMVKSLSGDRLLASAHNLTAAVQKIGGASRLTEAEQARVNKTVSDAIAKYAALGHTAPASMLELEKATRRVVAPTDMAGKSLSGMTLNAQRTNGAVQLLTRNLAAYISGAAIAGAIIRTINYAESLEKAAVALGATGQATQRLENIAVQSNTTLDAMTSSITMMQDRLAGGDKSAVEALRQLGLTVEQVFALNPDQQFMLIARSLQQIASSEKQIQLGKDIFGRSAVEIMGALRSEVDKLANSIRLLSPLELKQLQDAENSWDRATLAVRRYGGAMLGVFMNPFGSHSATMGPFTPIIAPDLPRAMPLKAPAIDPPVPTGIRAVEEQSQKLQQRWVQLQILSDDLFGRDVIARAQDIAAAIGNVANLSKLSAEKQAEVNTVMRDAIGVYERLGRTAPQRMIAIANATGLAAAVIVSRTEDVALAMRALPTSIDAAAESINANLIPAMHGLDEAFGNSARLKALNDELARLGMLLPNIAIQSERVTDEIQAVSDAQEDAIMSNSDALLSGTQSVFQALGDRYKAMAIAGAIISTYSAIAKSLASAPWPFNLALAAGAAAVGWANVNAIRKADPGFEQGTRDLDFQNFGRRRTVELHGEEAVIPRGRGHVLAEEIAAALSNVRTPLPRAAHAFSGLALQSGGGMRPTEVHQHNTVHFHSQSLTTEGYKQVFEQQIIPRLEMELLTNQRDLVTTINRIVRR